MPLELFLPPVRAWFEATFACPTPVQIQGWPLIDAGKNALLLAPTGSGKTLAAFLACLNHLWRQPRLARRVHVLYISPLKALNNDIYRNLDVPLQGVADVAQRMGHALPRIEVGLRTGDTPAAERQRLLRRPPHVLITTPESLHLMLTSSARESLRGISHCIVDEIHALCPNKRGVFLSLLLERLEALRDPGRGGAPRPAQHQPGATFQRIGLSATQRPLDEVARFLGGGTLDAAGVYRPRPVTIVDTGLRKDLDLRIISPVEQFGPLPEKSVWPSIYRLLADLIESHRSTLIFANNRRVVEHLTAQLQEVLAYGGHASMDNRLVFAQSPTAPNEPAPDEAGGAQPAEAAFARVRAHHGSVALEVRRQTEQALKNGDLRAVVATASLELGIDMGAVDLVCQLESPGSVARGLQRVGRAGHIVGQSSKGRLIPKTLADLVDQAVLAAEMAAGNVEELRVPANCLDVLAQQIVAMVAMESWSVADLHRRVRQAYPYRDLSPAALDSVLEMVSGRYRFERGESEQRVKPGQRLSALAPRVSWDRVHGRIHALPGSQRLALTQGGAIPDTGQYSVYSSHGLRLGELDEEFVYERRVGDTFLLGTNAWRISQIDVDRVIVEAAAGQPALVPFWRGERAGRSHELGRAQARFLGELARRMSQPDCQEWLQRDYFVDETAARNLMEFVRRQVGRTGKVSDETTLVVEAARDPLGDWQVVLHSPFGSRFNLTLSLALENALTRRLGYRPQCLHHDDGILVRLTESEEPVLDVLSGLTVETARTFILDSLADSALFALRFRQNAARALMMPRAGAGRRAPLWLQRLRGRDLLQVARQFPDFPIVAETFRECLHDHLDVPRVEGMLAALAAGDIALHTCRLELPSPFAAGLWFAFNAANMYQYDDVEAEPGRTFHRLDQGLLDQLITDGSPGLRLDSRAVAQVERRLRNVGRPPRSTAEMAEWLRRIGDLTAEECEGPMAGFVAELLNEGRIVAFDLPAGPRWVLKEDETLYRDAFGPGAGPEQRHEACSRILDRFLQTHALVSLAAVLERYPLEPGWARRRLEEWSQAGRAVAVALDAEAPALQWSAPENLEQMQRGTLAILRREIVTSTPAQFSAFQLRWQRVDSAGRDAFGLDDCLRQLQGWFLPVELWEEAILPARLSGHEARRLSDEIAAGRWLWTGRGEGGPGPGDLAFFSRDDLPQQPPPPGVNSGAQDAAAAAVLGYLQRHGASFVAELAQSLGLTPGRTRAALWNLVRLGLASNDLFDVLRRGEEPDPEDTPVFRTSGQLRGFLKGTARRRPASDRPEGRWFLVPWARPDAAAQAILQAAILLARHGVAARELAVLDDRMPPWRVLYEVYSRMEMAGDVRRGYFVEGLSGAQFALPEAVRLLQETLGPTPDDGLFLLHSLDPANLYGSRAPFPWPLNENGFGRRTGNWLVLHGGKPILLIEQSGKRLRCPEPIAPGLLARATALLPRIAGSRGLRDLRHKLTVETWNDQAVTLSEARPHLEAAGFVRDYQAMTWYAAWQPGPLQHTATEQVAATDEAGGKGV